MPSLGSVSLYPFSGLSIEAAMGSTAEWVVPSPVVAEIQVGAPGNGAWAVPAPVLDNSADWGLALNIPATVVAGTVEKSGEGAWTVRAPRIIATGTNGSVASGAWAVSGAQLRVEVEPGGEGVWTTPGVVMAGTVFQELVWDLNIIAPAARLRGSVQAVFIPAPVKTVVVNLRTGGHVEYLNYNFNSMAKVGTKYYGVMADGVYLLEGATDQGTYIEAEAITRLENFSTERNPGIAVLKKRIAGVYVHHRHRNAAVRAVAIVDEEEKRYSELHPNDPRQGMHTRRAVFGRGLTGRNWQFGVANVDGGDLEVERIDVPPILLSRRVV